VMRALIVVLLLSGCGPVEPAEETADAGIEREGDRPLPGAPVDPCDVRSTPAACRGVGVDAG